MRINQGTPFVFFAPEPDQSKVNRLELIIRSISQRIDRTNLYVSCGGVGLPITINAGLTFPAKVGDCLIMEFPKGAHPFKGSMTAIYPAHLKPKPQPKALPQPEPESSQLAINSSGISMSSLEIAEMLGARHDNVKRTIDRLSKQGVISQPPLEDGKKAANGVVAQMYVFTGEQGKRDSIVVVAQLSPEFTAQLVDRWQELEKQLGDRLVLPQKTQPLGRLKKS